MARDWKITYSASASSATHIATFPSAAVAGRKLVAFGVAPASVDPSGSWTEIGEASDPSLGDLSVATLTAAGGETTLTWVREPSTSTSPRTLAGWVESRDDIGAVHAGTYAAYGNPSGVTSIDLAPIVTTVDGCRIYVAVATSNDATSWTPAITGLTVEDVVAGPALGNEPVRLAVASAVVAAGSYNISITGVPINPAMVVAFALEPADLTPPPPAETVIEEENRNIGVDKTTWDVSGAGDTTIFGFATSMHVARGTGLEVKVHSPSSAWTGKVYRLGWYGSRGAREIATITGPQTTQPSGTTDATTGMVSCANWSVNGNWSVPADATPGVYVIAIYRNDLTTAKSHIGPFVVTNPARKAAIAVKLSDTTWAAAYNHAGANPADIFNGKSLYGQGSSSGFTADNSLRCKAVSYDRPIVTRRSYPQTHFFNAEYPLLRWIERLGYDVDYLTCAQVDADPTLLLGREVVVSSGHDEYWSAGIRDAFINARDHSTQASHAVYLSGNEAFWRIRFATDRRSYACWKDTHDGALNTTGLYSGTWQDTRGFNTDRRPAALLNGQRFRLNGIAAQALVATSAHAGKPMWRNTAVAALTGSSTWTSAVGIVGFEADEPADTNPSETPTGLMRLSQASNSVSGQLSDDNGNLYNLSGTYVHAITAFRAASGAAVFAFGTCQYAWGLDEVHDRHPGGTLVSSVLQQALTNLFADLGTVPPAYPFPSGLEMPTPVALTSYGFPDVAAPTAPTSLHATAGQTQIALTWVAATDDTAVTGYDLYRDGTLVQAGVTALTYTFTGLTGSTSYTLGVRAKDAAGNASTPATVTAETSASTIAVTLDEVKRHGNITGTASDDELPLFIETAQQMVGDLIGLVLPTTVTAEHHAVWPRAIRLWLRRSPVLAVTAVQLLSGTTTVTLSSSDWHLDQETGALYRLSGGSYTYWSGDVLVTYQAGRNPVPAGVRWAIMEQAIHLWRSTQAQRGGRARGDISDAAVAAGFGMPNRVRDVLLGALPPPAVA
ncbi:N,N-dimethylformamidase beta subunit family domain-containing protein [Actinoplanes regularis]|uniref:N,N-dimethylformamidase beta subunit family domain-containing protein n=1 Tax=Actinoplanes regularis TaxID=52697 RepID=UPI0024A3E23A|nr:N,N-dimethylformamidase beta subunit family domain-containing protein [Actinoplanes regularis]GLW32271.1 hypothetical protein Areg01_52100 [Actinoplanes regularis]